MGDYNPRKPFIVGQEWVPIKFRPYAISRDRETGYTFRLNTSSPVVSGNFTLIADPIVATSRNALMAVYPRSVIESPSGPVREVIVPCNAGSVSGGATISLAASVQEAVADPNDIGGISLQNDTQIVEMFFAFNSFPELTGKRVLNIEALYQLSVSAQYLGATVAKFVEAGGELPSMTIAENSAGTGFADLVPNEIAGPDFVQETTIGELDLFHGETFFGGNINILYPWIYPNLQLFEQSTTPANRMSIQVQGGDLPTGITLFTVRLGYFALRVTYCDENRLLVGSRLSQGTGMTNLTPLRSPVSLAPGGAVLPTGDYVVTVTEGIMSDRTLSRMTDPMELNGIQQLDALPSHMGVEVKKTLTLDQEFETDETDQLIQITLHTANTVVTGSHPYGTQLGVPVYDGVTASQEIDRATAPTAATFFPFARFYARRYGHGHVPLTLTGLGQVPNPTATLSQVAFDALPELTGGWKEVTLSFASPTPSFSNGAGVVAWQWSATGLAPGDQWQILATDAPAASGGVANLDAATYLAPLGGQANLTWRGVSDTSADATLMFSQVPPAAVGLALSTLTQAVTGISQECSVTNRCVPTGIFYNRLTWNSTQVICDDFSVASASGWNGTNTNQTWSTSGGVATDYTKVDGVGVVTLNAVNAERVTFVASGPADFDNLITVKTDVLASGAPINAYVIGRWTDINNHYRARIAFNTDQTISVAVERRLAGVTTNLGSVTVQLGLVHVVNTEYSLRFQGFGTNLQVHAWQTGLTEPGDWTVVTTDANFTTGGTGTRSILSAGNTNTLPVQVKYTYFSSVLYGLQGSYYELQRTDTIVDEWQTIMRTEGPCVNALVDYEARVGTVSRYRIRTCNELSFCGDWSAEVTGTITAPGITTTGDGNGVLIFTSNECQSGLANLAYSMVWEGDVVEGFTFPEADEVRLQRVFNRDFAIALHGSERGGERFTRALLIETGAIAAPSLANFRSIRDLGWENLAYVCVRDELGNRWFANVRVPEGVVRRNRRTYVARVDIAEVTGTPTPVDPGSGDTCP